ncbi:MAG: hypothetical protein RLZZ387_4960, partial [Chloroflexota bacterium]
MAVSMLEQLQAIDPNLLTEIARNVQDCRSFTITDWHVDRLSTKGIINPDGLFLFQGTGHDGRVSRPWSTVLKIIRRGGQEHDLRSIWYWKRELHTVQSGLLTRLPGGIRAPRIYAATEHTDSAWIWMEHIVPDSAQLWTPAQYALAARAVGTLNGAYLAGTPLPDEPWLCTEHCGWWLAAIEHYDPERAWENRFVRAAFPTALRLRVERLRADRERFLAVLTQLPQVFSHFDAQRRNLFIRTHDDTPEVVAIDWALVGCGPVGGELCVLLADSALLCELAADDVPELEEACTAAYLSGLADAGWSGDPGLVRLGYCAWFAMHIGAAAPGATVAWTGDETGEAMQQAFGWDREAVVAQWARLCELALDRADEARHLMERL